MLGIMLVALGVWQLAHSAPPQPPLQYSEFFRLVQEDRVERVELRGNHVRGKLRSARQIDGRSVSTFETIVPSTDPDLWPTLRAHVPAIDNRENEEPLITQVVLGLLPWALIIGLWVWLSRRAQGMIAGGGPLSTMVKGRAKRFEKRDAVEVRFDDVAGLHAAKRDLGEVVSFLREPERFRRLGGRVPRGLLLVGPPGTGKTLLARAVAGEAGVAFFSISGSEFIEMFVGVGASRVRELFQEARKSAPAIVFIDEIDAVGRARGVGLGGGNDEREQTLNQLLAEMDGFEHSDETIVLAATNRPDVLDAALLRPGRFDRQVMVDRPELDARKSILQVHLRKKPISEKVDIERVARDTPGFSGADLANLVNEAALHATRRDAEEIGEVDFAAAYDKIVLGDPRESKLGRAERRRVAVHEAGHAIAAHFGNLSAPLRRITILPRAKALGATQQVPQADRHLKTRPELEAELRVLLGGFVAEQLVLGSLSTGASEDLKQASALAFEMVAQYGMSESIGPVYYDHRVRNALLGQSPGGGSGVSPGTLARLEKETRSLLSQARVQADRVLRAQRATLDHLVEQLLERESLEGPALLEALGESPSPVDLSDPPPVEAALH